MSKISQAVKDFRSQVEPSRPVVTGWMVDEEGIGSAEVTAEPGYVYVRIDRGDGTNSGDVTKARARIRPVAGWPVIIGETRERPWEYTVLSIDDVQMGTEIDGKPSLEHHHEMHEWGNEDGGDDTVYIRHRQIADCRVYASSPASMVVNIADGTYLINRKAYYYGSGSQDLTAYVPGAGWLWVVIALDEDETVQVVEGDAAPFVTLDDIPSVPSTYYQLAAVRLKSTTTSITDWPDEICIVDLRYGQGSGLGGEDDHFKLADGQLPVAETTLYTADGNTRVDTIRLHNTHTTTLTCTIKMNDRIIGKINLASGRTYIDTAPRTLTDGDILEGFADTADKVDYYIGGIEDVQSERLVDGRLGSIESTLYTTPAGKRIRIESITFHNTHTAALDVTLKADSRIIKDFELGAGYTHIDMAELALEAADTLAGYASTAAKVDYYISGTEENE